MATQMATQSGDILKKDRSPVQTSDSEGLPFLGSSLKELDEKSDAGDFSGAPLWMVAKSIPHHQRDHG